MKPRIEVLTNGITREAIAEQTHLFYEPATQSARVAFQYRPNLYLDGVHSGAAGDYGVVETTVDAIATQSFGEGLVDPVTGRDLGTVSVAGIILLIKAAFPVLYDRAYASTQDEPEAVPSA